VEIIPWLKERLCVAKFHDISCSKDLGTSKPTLIGVAGCTCRDCEMASTLLKRHAAGEHASEGLDAYVTNQRGELFQGKAALESGPGIAKLPHQQPDNSVPFLLEDLVGGDVP
jgi:hypothetical protein